MLSKRAPSRNILILLLLGFAKGGSKDYVMVVLMDDQKAEMKEMAAKRCVERVDSMAPNLVPWTAHPTVG